MELALCMSLVREEAKQAELAETKADLAEKVKEAQDLQEQLKDALAEPRENLFWEVAHKVFQPFPRCREDLPADVGIGCSIGPCKLEGLLGRGGFCAVYSARNLKSGECEAVKVIQKSQLDQLGQVAQVWKEIKALRGLSHPNIVAFRGAWQGPAHIFLRMENVGGMNLLKGMKMSGGALRMEMCQSFAAQLAMALEHSASNGVAHRDLKPENVVVSGCHSVVKLVDWGSAALLDEPCDDMAGTMPFMAPEVLEAEDRDPYNPGGVDVWGLGVVVLEMLCGVGALSRMVGWDASMRPTRERGADLRAFFAAGAGEGGGGLSSGSGRAIAQELARTAGEAPEALVDLLEGMLCVDLEKRLTATQVLESPWLQDFI